MYYIALVQTPTELLEVELFSASPVLVSTLNSLYRGIYGTGTYVRNLWTHDEYANLAF